MEQSESIDQLTPALVAAKLAFGKIKKSQTGKISGEGKGGAYEYSYKYADLAETLSAVEPHLLANGLVLQQDCVNGTPGYFTVITQLTHISGQWQRFQSPPMPYKEDPKRTGASQSYGRRYGVAAALSLATEDDTDAHGDWHDRPAPAQQTAARPQQDRSQTAARQSGAPGDYIFPIGKQQGYQGKPIREVPEGFLREFIMSDKFDKQDIKDATQRFLDTLATKEEVEFVQFALMQTGGDNIALQADIDAEREAHFKKVRRGWLDKVEEMVLGSLDAEQVRLLREDFKVAHSRDQKPEPRAENPQEEVDRLSGELAEAHAAAPLDTSFLGDDEIGL